MPGGSQTEKLPKQCTGVRALLRSGHSLKLLHSIKNHSSILRKTLKHGDGNSLKGRNEGSTAVQLPGLGYTDVSIPHSCRVKHHLLFFIVSLLTEAVSHTKFLSGLLYGPRYPGEWFSSFAKHRTCSCCSQALNAVWQVGSLDRDVWLWELSQAWSTPKTTCVFSLTWVTKLQAWAPQ